MFEIFAIVSAISAVFSAYKAISEGNAASAAAEASAEQSRQNAKIAQQQAAATIDQGDAQKNAIRLKLASMRATGRVGYAAGNVALGSGSPEDLEADNALLAQMGLDTIDTNTSLEAWSHRVQAIDYTNQANILRAQAANYKSAGYMSAGGSLLSGASAIYGGHLLKGTSGLGAANTDSSILGNSGFGA